MPMRDYEDLKNLKIPAEQDPFSGSGTTAVVAQKNGRNWIGIDANADYCELAQARIIAETRTREEAVND